MLTKEELKIKRRKMKKLEEERRNKKPRGRPTIYSSKIADHICREIAKGRSLKNICTNDSGMPTEMTVYSWLQKDNKYFNEDFFYKYRLAKDMQAERFAEEIIEIADNSENDIIERKDPKTGEVKKLVNYENIKRAELRLKARIWATSKILPKKYGDSSRLELSGKDGERLFPTMLVLDFSDDAEKDK